MHEARGDREGEVWDPGWGLITMVKEAEDREGRNKKMVHLGFGKDFLIPQSWPIYYTPNTIRLPGSLYVVTIILVAQFPAAQFPYLNAASPACLQPGQCCLSYLELIS